MNRSRSGLKPRAAWIAAHPALFDCVQDYAEVRARRLRILTKLETPHSPAHLGVGWSDSGVKVHGADQPEQREA